MIEEEVRVRSVYLFVSCAQLIEECKERLVAKLPVPSLSSKVLLDKAITRELGLLFRYWATRSIWEKLAVNEESAKQLNLALLRLFTNGLKLPKDGSGLKYAELSVLSEEARELSHRMTAAIGSEHPPLLAELHGSIAAWRAEILKHTADALQRPLDQLTGRIKDWAQSGASGTLVI